MSIPLPPLPRPYVPGDEFNPTDFYSADQLRARDQEIVRCVLEAAAKVARDSGVCPWAVAIGIEQLEFHHE